VRSQRIADPMIPRVLIAAFLLALSAIDCHADVALMIADVRNAADTLTCSTKLLGKTVVATLNRVPFLTLSANGHSVTLILDTGAERTVLTPEAARTIKAQRPAIELSRRLYGVGGDLETHEVELRSFSAGGVAIPWHRVLVAPVKAGKVFPTPLDGLLGSDVLSDFDVDLDFPEHMIGFYQKQSCSTAAPNWAGPYTVLSTGLSPGGRFFFPVQLNGHRLTATIDTGSQFTVLATTAARSLGVTEAALSGDRSMNMQGVAGAPLSSRLHRFATLELGNLLLHNPEIVVTDVNIREADLVLGIDLLNSRRVWLSYGSRRIFIGTR
jgi:predicted aspartyl protease